MGIISGDCEINDADFRGYDDEISRSFEQPELAPTKVRESDAYDPFKLDARLAGFDVADRERILRIVDQWLANEEVNWRRGNYPSALNTANSLKVIRENRMRNK